MGQHTCIGTGCKKRLTRSNGRYRSYPGSSDFLCKRCYQRRRSQPMTSQNLSQSSQMNQNMGEEIEGGLGFESDEYSEVKFSVPPDEPCPSPLSLSQFDTRDPCPGLSSIELELRQVLGPLCDLTCRTCMNYIHRLCQHIQIKHRNSEKEKERKHESPYVQTQSSLSPMDSDLHLHSECDGQIELEGPTLPTVLPQRKRGRPTKSAEEKILKLTCTYCQKMCTGPQDLRVHLRTHTREKPFRCDTCQKSFRHREGLKKHERIHTGVKPFKCAICQRAYERAYLLKFHVQKMHTGENRCDICNRTFSTKCHLASHKIGHARQKVKQFMCEICSCRSYSNSALERHMRTHTGEKPFMCDQCGKGLSSKTLLNSHIYIMHTKEKPSYPCDVCEQNFTDPKQLVLHKRIHTGEEVIQCELCPKYFLKKKGHGLWAHMHSHRTEKAFECDKCHKMYKTKSILKQHYAKHIGAVEKAEKCEECGKSYDMPYMLRLHIQRVHNNNKKHEQESKDK